MPSVAAARRAAINLNNCGVALLSRHLWDEAMDAFKDAIGLMKIASTGQKGTVSEQEMHLALHRAWQSTAQEFTTATEDCQGSIVKIISSQCDPAAFYALLNSSSPEDTKFLVTIDPIDSEDQDSDGTDLEASIVLYNFGIAHSFLGSASGCRFGNAKLQDNAYRILHLTYALAFKLFCNAVHKSQLCTYHVGQHVGHGQSVSVKR
jgi:hypothetical protein